MSRYQTIPAAFLAFLSAALVLPVGSATPEDRPIPGTTQSVPSSRGSTHRIIVKYRERATEASGIASISRSLRDVSESAGLELSFVREMGTGAKVFALPKALPLNEVEEIARKISSDPSVEYAEPDIRMYPLLAPNDPQYGN